MDHRTEMQLLRRELADLEAARAKRRLDHAIKDAADKARRDAAFVERSLQEHAKRVAAGLIEEEPSDG